ncbi:MAG TPA: aspartyl protease family protein [Myxococcota bacterium]|nr:aspartyl protease family protein [Myxococcota bacterium]
MILLLACRPPVVPIEPPSAEALLDAYAAQVDSRTTRSLRSSVRVQDLQGTLTETWVDGDYEAWLELSGLRMGWGLVDGVGWEKRPTWSRVWGPRLEELAFNADPSQLIAWREHIDEVVHLGAEDPGWHLRIRWRWGLEEHWWIDPQTGLLSRAEERHPMLDPHVTVIGTWDQGLPSRTLSGSPPLVFETELLDRDAEATPPSLPAEVLLTDTVEFPLNDMQSVIQVGDDWLEVHVDTGSSLTLLPSGPPGGLTELASTPGGSTAFRQVDVERSQPVPLGGVAIIEHSPFSLLGQDVLGRGVAVFSEEGLRLVPFDDFETDMVATPLSINRDGQWLVQIGDGQVHFPALLDTGAEVTVLNRAAAAALGIRPDDPRLVHSGSLAGLEGRPVPAYAITIAELHVGQVPVAWDTEVLIAELPGINALADGPAAVLGVAQLPETFATDPRGSLYLPRSQGM